MPTSIHRSPPQQIFLTSIRWLAADTVSASPTCSRRFNWDITLADLTHLWGNDLAWSATGDLATADVPSITQQRLLRRLLTNPGEYIWASDFGAGLASYVGQPGANAAIRAAIRGQLSKEADVSQTPAAMIDLVPDVTGILYVYIRYADAAAGTTETVAFFT